MKLRKFALTTLIFIVLFTNELQCRDSEERRIRRNEKREERKLRRLERSRRLRNREKSVTEKDNVFFSEMTVTTPAPSQFVQPRNPEDMVRKNIRMQLQRARHRTRLHEKKIRQEAILDGQQATAQLEDSVTPVNDNLYGHVEIDNVNITWSGDHDLVSINTTLNETYLVEEHNATQTNETIANGTRNNITSTPVPPRTTPDANKLDIWRIKQR